MAFTPEEVEDEGLPFLNLFRGCLNESEGRQSGSQAARPRPKVWTLKKSTRFQRGLEVGHVLFCAAKVGSIPVLNYLVEHIEHKIQGKISWDYLLVTSAQFGEPYLVDYWLNRGADLNHALRIAQKDYMSRATQILLEKEKQELNKIVPQNLERIKPVRF